MCSVCGETKEISDFGRYSNSKDGYRGVCKVCRKEYPKVKKITNSKVCNKCSIEKPLEEFHVQRTSSFGRHNTCKECLKPEVPYKFELPSFRICKACNTELPIDNFRRYPGNGASHTCLSCEVTIRRERSMTKPPYTLPTKVCTGCGKTKNVSEFHKAYNGYTHQCKECVSKQQREIYQSDPEKMRKRTRDYRRNNPNFKEMDAIRSRNRRARVNNAIGSHTKDDIDLLLANQNFMCVYCPTTLHEYHVDHIFSLNGGRAGNPNGHNGAYNLQVLCPTCNLNKHAKDPIIFESNLGILTDERFAELLSLREFMFGPEIPEGKYDDVVLI